MTLSSHTFLLFCCFVAYPKRSDVVVITHISSPPMFVADPKGNDVVITHISTPLMFAASPKRSDVVFITHISTPLMFVASPKGNVIITHISSPLMFVAAKGLARLSPRACGVIASRNLSGTILPIRSLFSHVHSENVCGRVHHRGGEDHRGGRKDRPRSRSGQRSHD